MGGSERQPAVHCLNPNRIVAADDAAPGGRRWLYPQSHHTRAASRGILGQIEPDDDAYQIACDKLEYLASGLTMDKERPSGWPWAGEFLSRGYFNGTSTLEGLESLRTLGAGSPQVALEALRAWIAQHPRF